MLLPVGDDRVQGRYKPVFTYLLILVNCYVFWQELQLSEEGLETLFYNYGAIPETILQGSRLHTVLTSVFLHGGWMHLISNMLFLWIFAENIEVTIGNFRFLLFYLAGGVFAVLVHCFVFEDSRTPCIGASGAIASTLGAYLVMFPSSRIKMFFFFFFFRVSAFVFLGFWILQQLLNGWASLYAQPADSVDIGYWAHIGGFGYGLIRGFFYRQEISKALIEY
ncbi:MAG TPA: rhomboid family intramembrane serine protease [Sphingobacteriaceae bacterium]